MRQRDPVVVLQAEDGIRDIGVTGVQTCALPIYGTNRLRLSAAEVRQLYGLRAQIEEMIRVCKDQLGLAGCQARSPRAQRSEERRVGKECRSRWSPYH